MFEHTSKNCFLHVSIQFMHLLCMPCAVVERYVQQHLKDMGLSPEYPTFVTDCGGNVAAAFDGGEMKEARKEGAVKEYDWMRCSCHLFHNVVTAGLKKVENLGRQGVGGERRHMLHNALTRCCTERLSLKFCYNV